MEGFILNLFEWSDEREDNPILLYASGCFSIMHYHGYI